MTGYFLFFCGHKKTEYYFLLNNCINVSVIRCIGVFDDIVTRGVYLTFKRMFYKTLKSVKFDCEITLGVRFLNLLILINER